MAKLKKSEEEAELKKNPINVFTCGHADCNKLDSMEFKDFKQHLLEVHKIESNGMKGNRQMTMHMDGDFWYSYSYQWVLDSGLKFYQYIRQAREKDDPMRMEY